MPDILMKCGCRANATDGNRPCCAVHAGLTPLAYEIAETPNLEGRMARCYCGKEEPSSLSLAFFEYRGVGSLESVESCKHCHMHKEAHVRDPNRVDPSTVVERGQCPGFQARGALDHDRYYCGHAGFD